MPMEFQVSSGAPHLASKPAYEYQDSQAQLYDDPDRPPVHEPEGAKGRDLVIHHFILFQTTQSRVMGGDGGR
jgi:hypothetical protein